MFFARKIHTNEVDHHRRMSAKAIIFNTVACSAWVAIWVTMKRSSYEAFFLMPLFVLVVVAALYIHISGAVYSMILARKCRMYERATLLFLLSVGPLIALATLYHSK